MSRSSFSRSSTDSNPLFPNHEDRRSSFSLQNLSPRQAPSTRAASPSPPPSFYRLKDTRDRDIYNDDPHRPLPSPSPSKIKDRRIQFAAPPPPIAASVVLPTRPRSSGKDGRTWGRERGGTSSSPRRNSVTSPLHMLAIRERAISQELQTLLDAQSAGLIHGFGGHTRPSALDSHSDAGSSTPTSRSVLWDESRSRSRNVDGGVVPVRQPKKKHIGLRGARRGLLRDMGELVGVKEDQISLLNDETDIRNDALSQVDTWEKRIEGVRQQLNGAQGETDGEDARELEELKTEGRAVDNEIQEMEDRLAQMKARKRWLAEKVKEGVNRQEARLSSYRGALREAESEIKQFLKRSPVTDVVLGEEEGFMTLPPARRTLGMAREWWSKELVQLAAKKKELEKERIALDDGAELWRDTVQVVTDFEDDLRKQMATSSAQDPSMLKAQIDKMGSVISTLSTSVSMAESKGWNLLICAIGAELEAFREGQGILSNTFETKPGTPEDRVKGKEKNLEPLHGIINGQDSQEEMNGSKDGEKSVEDSEDDGPSPEFLIESRH